MNGDKNESFAYWTSTSKEGKWWLGETVIFVTLIINSFFLILAVSAKENLQIISKVDCNYGIRNNFSL